MPDRSALGLDADSAEANVTASPTPTDGKWSFLVNPNGSFLIRNDTTQKCLDYDDSGRATNVVQSDCDAKNPKQSWYVQPTSGNRFRVRNANANSPAGCMYPYNDFGRFRVATTVNVSCAGHDNELWTISGTDKTASELTDMATAYALKQCGEESDVIKSCGFAKDSDETATVGNVQRVAESDVNGTADPLTKALAWTQSTSATTKVGVSFTFTYEHGTAAAGLITNKVSASLTSSFEYSTTDTHTETNTSSFVVNPGQFGWVLRAQLMKTVSGNWTFTTDMGDTWSDSGTTTLPVKDGTDGEQSVLYHCTSDGTNPVCNANRPQGV